MTRNYVGLCEWINEGEVAKTIHHWRRQNYVNWCLLRVPEIMIIAVTDMPFLISKAAGISFFALPLFMTFDDDS